ncbi:MAG: stage II sporulation protein P [Clostridiales bacterium]|nr:stage II sporulation protein P [Clostridiales bacterium]
MKMRWIAGIVTVLMLLCPLAAADEADEGQIYSILDQAGALLTHYAGKPDAGDEYVTGDNRHFRIEQVNEGQRTATAAYLGEYELPDVSWLSESAQPVSAKKRAVALYCTHSDESYEPTDGVSSDEQRGGIYDVAEAFKEKLEEEGITVYFSDETHHPHDSGAYRRSRATAANLVEEGVDAVMDIHRDGIPDPESYESKIDGEDATMVRLLVGRSNQNAGANKQFAAQIKAVADELYPGLIKDIYMGKGSYNQDLMGQAILLEFGTYTNDKQDVLASTGYMADVMNKTLYGGVSGAAGSSNKMGAAAAARDDSGSFTGIAWLIGLFAVGAIVFAFIASGRGGETMKKFKRTFQEMGGGLLGGEKKEDKKK